MGTQERKSNDAEIIIELPGKKETRRGRADWTLQPKSLKSVIKHLLKVCLTISRGGGNKRVTEKIKIKMLVR